MQILIRRLGKTLCIGDDIEVTVLAIKGDEVRLGVEPLNQSRCNARRPAIRRNSVGW